MGFSDKQLAFIWKSDELTVRSLRKSMGIVPVYKTVDTCAAEFEAETPYFYSTYESETERTETGKKKIIILGGGPNRIGQGIEFDYCCVHGVYALQEEGYEVIMINCNPETVSTDYDTSDRLYFEPLTFEDVMNIIEVEKPEGVIVQFGGQTPLKLAIPLMKAGVKIIGTSPDDIDMAEDRKKFGALLSRLNIECPEYGTATSFDEAHRIANKIGYPVLVRPSYVLGGRAMEIVYDDDALERYMTQAIDVSPEHPILVDKFLVDAIEFDVDALCDGKEVFIGGVMQHIEEAGIHSGDSSCVLPPYSASEETLSKLRVCTAQLAKELNVIGLINIQYAVQNSDVYVLEVNPRASRTVPFVSKAIGIPLAKMAARIMVGKSLKELGLKKEIIPHYTSVKDPVFPFAKFPGIRMYLSPEMRSTGEVMGIADNFPKALAKAHIAAGMQMPTSGGVFITVNDQDKNKIAPIAKELTELGFTIYATEGTQTKLLEAGIDVKHVFKLQEGRPHVIDRIKNKEIHLVINTPTGKTAKLDERYIGEAAMLFKIPMITTIPGAIGLVKGIRAIKEEKLEVMSIQELHATLK
ncbi:carbamoyl-phosphate synthase large subunit [bacterium]|nr:MAG: carbamoyl-phosphate synthase large subunit [bacterium]